MPRSMKNRNVHEPKPDVKYGSVLLSKFINLMMYDGKRSTAERLVYKALSVIQQKLGDVKPLEVFETAISNVKPLVEVSPKRQMSLAVRWIRAAARGKKGRPMHQRLAAELIDAYHREGAAMTVRENTHRMAEANKAFAHFAW